MFSANSTHLLLRRKAPTAAGGAGGRGGAATDAPAGGGGAAAGGTAATPTGPRGTDVIVHNLVTGRDQLLGSVGDIAFNRPGDLLAYTVDATVKDGKLYPGGARAWDWRETGTRHRPGIQPADVAELVEHGATTIVLSMGALRMLQVCAETLRELERKRVTVEVFGIRRGGFGLRGRASSVSGTSSRCPPETRVNRT